MNIEKINPNIKYLYHYTLKTNVEKILKDKEIKSKDRYVFFTKNLDDSILAFEREMMQENKLYIDVEGVLRKREKCNKNDYCILKIPYINDNQFYKFNFENQSKESIYTISISHNGAYPFKKAQVLEIPQKKNMNLLAKTAMVAISAGIILSPYNVYSASWLDTNNYDTSWYVNETNPEYVINTAKQMAGLAHLVNNENKTFEGKSIRINNNIDLTENTWETIKDIFKGSICGSHRIILNYLDGKLVEDKQIDLVAYSYKVLVDNKNLENIIVEKPYTVEKLKQQIPQTNLTVFFNNVELPNDKSLLDLDFKEDDIIDIFTGGYIYIQNSKGIKMPLAMESGDSIDNIKEKYSEITNIPENKIIFKYNGKELNEERTLADYNIQKYETIDAYVKININASVEEGEGSITSSKNTAIAGEKITITLKPELEYELGKLLVNEIERTNEVQNNELNLECSDEDINVKVSYKLKEKDEESKDKTEEEELINNPETGDGIIAYIITFITSIVGLVICSWKKIKSMKD